MPDVLGIFPVAPLMVALLIPLIYGLKRRKSLKSVVAITLCSAGVVVLYPLVTYLSGLFTGGYALGKSILFVILPLLTVYYIERWSWKDIFTKLGVRKENISKSIAYGLLAAAVTIAITVLVATTRPFDALFGTIMFFEAFTEEFFFRGFLFLYLKRKSGMRIAFATSVLGFVLIHPQHFTSLFLLSTVAQGILLTMVTLKTRNIIGPWISHGLNRLLPTLIRSALGL